MTRFVYGPRPPRRRTNRFLPPTVAAAGVNEELSGTAINGAATVAGALNARFALSGTAVTGSATVAGAITRSRNLAGSANGTATVTGALAVQYALTGDITGSATVRGDLEDGGAAPAVEPTRGHGGWDPHYYKRRKKRKEPISAFLDKIEAAPLAQAPDDVQAKAEAARVAAEKYLADQTEALRERALSRIDEFYQQIAAEIARQAEDEDDTDFLLLAA